MEPGHYLLEEVAAPAEVVAPVVGGSVSLEVVFVSGVVAVIAVAVAGIVVCLIVR